MEQKKTYLVDNKFFIRGLYALAGLSVAAYGYTDCWDIKAHDFYKSKIKPQIQANSSSNKDVNDAGFPSGTYNATDSLMKQGQSVDSSFEDPAVFIKRFNQKYNSSNSYKSNHRFLNSQRERRLQDRMLDDLMMLEESTYNSKLPNRN